MKLINTALFCLWTLLASAQINYENIHVISEYKDGKVSLRWIPMNYGTWKSGNKHGYKVVRKDLSTNQEVVLKEGLKPISPTEFDNTFQNNNAAKSAKMMLYDMTINTAPAQASNLKDAVNINEQNEGRYLFAMVAAENDFEVAKAMALGLEDTNMDESLIYAYIVTINDAVVMETMSPAYTTPDFAASNLEPVSTLEINIDSDVSVLTWKIREFDGIYSAWNIERSYDGNQFVRLNSSPFMHGYSEEAYEYLASYQDPLGNCEGKLYYRVQGITPFGTEGPFSNVKEIICVSDRIRMPISINGSVKDNDNIVINWNNFDPVYQDSIIGFNIYRTPELTLPVEKINGELMSPDQRKFVDSSPLASAYYFLEAIDINDNIHRSAEYFIQEFDKVAPGIPVGLKGRFTSEQTLSISWNKNTETDFKGCDIAIANDRSAQFIKKNTEFVQSNNFSYTFNEGLVTDSVYVKIRSTDLYYNLSEYSEVYAFARPDVWAPIRPILEFAYPTPKGVALGWTYSASDDVVKHKLQRRPKGEFRWKDLLIVSKDKEANFKQTLVTGINDSNANHLDKYDQSSIEYQYRIIALDEANNQGISKILTVVPFLVQDRNLIKDFKVQLFSQPTEVNEDLKNQLVNLNSENLSDQLDALSADLYKAKITWKCELSESIAAFIIYRSMPKEGFKPIKECSLAEALGMEGSVVEVEGKLGSRNFGYVDENLERGFRYSYYIVAKFTNGSESNRSQTITKSVQNN